MTALRPILLLLTALSLPTAFAADTALMSKGQKIYETNCAACHGKKGEGRSAMFPPLFQSDYINKKPQVLFDQLPKQGTTKLDVFCPGFLADCLETMEEIAIMGREQFHAAGGKEYRYIPCLNDSADWIAALAQLSRANLQGWI